MIVHARPRSMLAGFVLLLVHSVSACEKQGLSERLHAEARVAAAEGRQADAEGAFSRAFAYDPNDQVALERLLELHLESGRARDATRLIALVPERSTRSIAVENLFLRLRLRAGDEPVAGIAVEAARLKGAGRLRADAERELLAAIVAEIVGFLAEYPGRPTEVLASRELPDSWFVAVALRLIEQRQWERASAALAERPDVRHEDLEHALLEGLRAADFAVDQAVLDRSTAGLAEPLAYLGRLEFLLRAGRDADAARLEPPAPMLAGDFSSEWDARWARYFARRHDWYGVLGRTGRAASSRPAEAQRRALRVLAYLARDRKRAKVELQAWLADPALAAEWGRALLVPEVESGRAALAELRAELEKPRPR